MALRPGEKLLATMFDDHNVRIMYDVEANISVAWWKGQPRSDGQDFTAWSGVAADYATATKFTARTARLAHFKALNGLNV